MSAWPNWIDLVVVIIVLRTCYNGFGHGLLTELLDLAGAVTITSLTLNYAGTVSAWLGRWDWLAPATADLAGFWGLFLALMAAVHFVARRVTQVIKWERLHWMVQGVGLILGGLRGLWWAGFLLMVLTSSGFVFLRQSVEARSVVGPRLLGLSRESTARVADVFPGAMLRSRDPVPPVRAGAT